MFCPGQKLILILDHQTILNLAPLSKVTSLSKNLFQPFLADSGASDPLISLCSLLFKFLSEKVPLKTLSI